MTAKEMFEALGYEQATNNNNFIEYLLWNRDEEDKDYFYVRFHLTWKSYVIGYCDGYEIQPIIVPIKEHKAITKQMEELGWV